MADIGLEEKYWSWPLTSLSQDAYYNVVNFDIDAPTYSFYGKKKRPTSFHYKKRKWYKAVFPLSYQIAFRWWEVSDVVYIDDFEWCNETECRYYVMLIHPTKRYKKVLTMNCDDCNIIKDLCWGDGLWYVDANWDLTDWAYTDSCYLDCACACWYNKFLITDFVRWTPIPIWPALVNTSTTWIQENIANGTVGIFYDEIQKTLPYAQVWHYIYVHGTNDTASCWQARQIVKIDRANVDRDYDILYVSSVWQYLSEDTDNNLTGKWAQYSIFPERWEVPVYTSCGWLNIIHSMNSERDTDLSESSEAFVTSSCNPFDIDSCIVSLSEFQWAINVLWDNGYSIYGWQSIDKFAFNANNISFLNEWLTTQVSFRNFLVYFGKRKIGVTVYNKTNEAFSYTLRNNLGIYSKYAYCEFENSLYFIGSDKTLYSVEIWADWQTYVLKLDDQSKQIRWDLDLLQKWDNVSLYADWQYLYIFINGKSDKSNFDNTKTKILKYNKHYQRWVQHHVCCGVISGKNENYFFGDTLYKQCWYKDCSNIYGWVPWQPNDWYWFDAYIEGIIWETESTNNEFTQFVNKQLTFAKVMLGKWVYTDGSTRFIVDSSYSWIKTQYNTSLVEHIEWIKWNNAVAQWDNYEIEQCVLDELAECNNAVRPCKDSNNILQSTNIECGCENDVEFDDNCICINDKSYSLSDIYPVYIALNHLKESYQFKFRIQSSNWDIMSFGGIYIGMINKNIAEHDFDNRDIINDWTECCNEWGYIDEYWNKDCKCA